MIPKKQRLSDEELKKLIDAYNVAKDKKTLIRINCVIALGDMPPKLIQSKVETMYL
jgi:DNA-directed RNA polymerase subunit H (RpoH/RPB5)